MQYLPHQTYVQPSTTVVDWFLRGQDSDFVISFDPFCTPNVFFMVELVLEGVCRNDFYHSISSKIGKASENISCISNKLIWLTVSRLQRKDSRTYVLTKEYKYTGINLSIFCVKSALLTLTVFDYNFGDTL